jgi:hypothetical protein
MREEDVVALNGAVEVDVGVLLEPVASRAGIQLEVMLAMTMAQLTSGLLPTGILPTASPASRVAVPNAPPTRAMCAQALGVEVLAARQSAGCKRGAAWAAVWEAEMHAAHAAPEPAAIKKPGSGKPGEPEEASDGGRERAARAASNTEHTKGRLMRSSLQKLWAVMHCCLQAAERLLEARAAEAGSADAPKMGEGGSQAGVSWATVAARGWIA